MSEQKDPVQEVENFLTILAIVCLVSWFIRLLCRPFQGIGFKGWFLGFFAVPALIFGLSVEVLSFVYAKNYYCMDCVTVVAPIANLRSETKIAPKNIVRTAKKGDKFCEGTASYSMDSKWLELKDNGGLVYIHKSTVTISEKKDGTDRSNVWDVMFFIALVFYGLCAFACWEEGQNRIKVTRSQRAEEDT